MTMTNWYHEAEKPLRGDYYFINLIEKPKVEKHSWDVEAIRGDFPYFSFPDNPIWFDNAATTQKPESVISAQANFYRQHYSNINRGAHRKARIATEMYEKTRSIVAKFLGASQSEEIVFVRGTTEGVNLLSNSLGESLFQNKEENILVMKYEHHANLVPWQMMVKKNGGKLYPIPCNEHGEVDLSAYEELLQIYKPAIVSLAHVSNALGTISPVKKMTSLAHSIGAIVIIDGAQAVPHMPVDVKEIDCDFYIFSGHKVFGPTGIGCVYGRKSMLDSLPPWQFGGNMIQDVTFERSTFSSVPARFEAGTPAISEAIGLGAALEYMMKLGPDRIFAYEKELVNYLVAQLSGIDEIKIIGTPAERASVVSFIIPNKDQTEFANFLDQQNIAVRIGHHCALPAVRCFGVSSTIRPSLAFYNTHSEIDRFVEVCRNYLR